MNDARLEIQKRHTLNWLIQGAAQHAGMTFHHLVRDQLNALDSRLVRFYDQYALINLLQYWQVDATILLGWPPRFWRRATSRRSHPFFEHPLLSKYGGMLAEAGRQRALARCKAKGLTRLPFAFSFQTMYVITRLRMLEVPHRQKLVQLAKETASMVWGIPRERLDAELTDRIRLRGVTIPSRGFRGAVFRAGIVGYGCVMQREEGLIVVGKGTNWQLVCKELVKGTAELICLHGINQLSDELYRCVMDVTDLLDVEPWMLQSGGELWRRLLEAFPDGQPLAKTLMQLARLPSGTLESIIAEVLDQPANAKARLAHLDQ
jgi:hypothetical protein